MIAIVRASWARIEKVFGTGGLVRASLHAHLTAIACNLRRAASLLRPQRA